MSETWIPVTFQPLAKTVHVLAGTSLLEAAARAGVVLDQPCGGAGVCGKCRVLVAHGTGPPTPAEHRILSAEELHRGLRLACQAAVVRPALVEIPRESLLTYGPRILTRTEGTPGLAPDPAVRKRYVELSMPSRADDRPDLMRLEEVLGPFDVDLDVLRKIPARLRANKFRGTAVVADGRLVDFEPGNTESQAYAVAVDVGTTTLVGALLHLVTGEELAVTSRLNPQTRFGDDVLSRILCARRSPEGLAELHAAIVEAVDEIIGELVEQADLRREKVYEVAFSGNTTMQQLLCGIDPSPLGQVPFVPAAARGLSLPAAELRLRVHPRASARILPIIGGFVGGDTVSAILVTSLADRQGPTLLIDIGTNGEIVLAARGRLWAASTAAGPAFEGARISHGMRGSDGAIEKVVVDDALRTNVIGEVRPIGLCGSALIDAAAELLRNRVLTREGRLLAPDQLPDGIVPDLMRRLTVCNAQPAFLLAAETETGHGRPILLTQKDLRELQLAAGAIRSGIVILLRRAGLQAGDLEAILIAGGFGNFIRRGNAQRIGLIPQGIPRDRILFQGNTSLAGARLIALSQEARRLAEHLARRAEHVDLSGDPDFQTTFAEAMLFPENEGD